jgi:hypothetical protein
MVRPPARRNAPVTKQNVRRPSGRRGRIPLLLERMPHEHSGVGRSERRFCWLWRAGSDAPPDPPAASPSRPGRERTGGLTPPSLGTSSPPPGARSPPSHCPVPFEDRLDP